MAGLDVGAAFVVVIGVVMALLPSVGHLAYNLQHFGDRDPVSV